MLLELDGQGTAYEQVARAICSAIAARRLEIGSRLPSTRSLSRELGLSRNTIVNAYELLRIQQWAIARRGLGMYVSRAPQSLRREQLIAPVEPQSRYASRARQVACAVDTSSAELRYDLQYGRPMFNAQLTALWRGYLSRAASKAPLRYPVVRGEIELREAVRKYLAVRRGVVCGLENVIIVHGTQQALALTQRVLVDEHESVVVEDPCYDLLANSLRAHGAELVPVAVDHEGLCCSSLPRFRPALICVSPSHQFPTGALMSLARRRELLAYARAHDTWIFEDDFDGEFRLDFEPVPALRALDASERVVYSGSFSKVMFPGLRLGYLVVPSALQVEFARAKCFEDLGCGVIEQLGLADFMDSGAFEKHLRATAVELRHRRTALQESLHRYCPTLAIGNASSVMHVVAWLSTFNYEQCDRLVEIARSRGLGLRAIQRYYARKPAVPGLMLGVAGLSPAQLRVSARMLGEIVAEVSLGASTLKQRSA